VDKGSNGVTGTALPDATVDLYSDPDDEGAFYIGSATADGTGSYSSAGSLALWAGSFVNATQTDVDGNTSEFSVPLPIPTGRVSVLPMVGDTLCLNHLDADQVVPPGASDAIGTATFAVETVGEAVLLRIDHTVQSPTAAEIRLGAPGENGPVVLDLGAPESPVIAVLQGIDFRTFTGGDHYLLISSSDAPAGEIRGPVLCPEPAPAVQALAALLGLLGLRVRCSSSSRTPRRARLSRPLRSALPLSRLYRRGAVG
jgi:hypothetical protein